MFFSNDLYIILLIISYKIYNHFCSVKSGKNGVPVLAQQNWIRRGTMSLQVQSLALLSRLRSGVAVSCGGGCRHGSDRALLWLWCRPETVVLIRILPWEPPYAVGVALKRQKTKKKKFTGGSVNYGWSALRTGKTKTNPRPQTPLAAFLKSLQDSLSWREIHTGVTPVSVMMPRTVFLGLIQASWIRTTCLIPVMRQKLLICWPTALEGRMVAKD